MVNGPEFTNKAVQEATTVEEREILEREGLSGTSRPAISRTSSLKQNLILNKIKQTALAQINLLKAKAKIVKDGLARILEQLDLSAEFDAEGFPLISEAKQTFGYKAVVGAT